MGAGAADKPLFVMIHGAWHGAWSYSDVLAELAKAGRFGIAIDLPGYGVNAKIPKSYYADPFCAEDFATEPSPVADITLEIQADAVVDLIEGLAAGGSGPVILLGHSMGGAVITAVAERIPHLVHRLVYLSAFMPESGVAPVTYIKSGANEGEKVGPLFVADPGKIGALRINPMSSDPAYRKAMVEAYAGTVDPAHADATLNLLTPDHPIGVPTHATNTTRERWGAVARTYVKALRDMAVRPRLQQTFIDAADAFTPDNPTHVVEMDSCHSPFHANPAGLARILAALS
ncbi:MAG: alpha/beta fold hydrolase [Rhodobiaceae bacterium]|nr:alpha/beta fold hydrolase [Rhodobiaceae bacterium]